VKLIDLIKKKPAGFDLFLEQHDWGENTVKAVNHLIQLWNLLPGEKKEVIRCLKKSYFNNNQRNRSTRSKAPASEDIFCSTECRAFMIISHNLPIKKNFLLILG
jgi:hypothetical protein